MFTWTNLIRYTKPRRAKIIDGHITASLFVCLNENPKEENIQAFCILENVFVISDLICSCAETSIPVGVLQLQSFLPVTSI